ncbi:MAG: hypothetical protein ACLT8E_02415 [Akkermansia sp.]
MLDMFPYQRRGPARGPSEGYTATDIVARFERMNGFNVLHPMGWDSSAFRGAIRHQDRAHLRHHLPKH